MRSGTLECSLIEDDLVGGSSPYDRLDTRRRALFHRRPVIADFAVRGETTALGAGENLLKIGPSFMRIKPSRLSGGVPLGKRGEAATSKIGRREQDIGKALRHINNSGGACLSEATKSGRLLSVQSALKAAASNRRTPARAMLHLSDCGVYSHFRHVTGARRGRFIA